MLGKNRCPTFSTAPPAPAAPLRPVSRLRPIAAIGPARIEVRGASKVFSSRGTEPFTALGDVSLKLGAGRVALVLGPSGSGKTTLLSLLGCMTRPTSGRIELAGRDVTRLPEDELALLRREAIGFVFQSNQLVRGASALVNVMLPALPSPSADGQLRHSARRLLARFGLAERFRERIERLSGGEQQRVAIARALVNDPDVVLADEPTSHLDRQAAGRFLDLVGELRDERKTVVVASHDASLAESPVFSDVFELSRGRLRSVV